MTSATPPEPDDAFQARYFRKGLGLRQEVRGQVASEYRSDWAQAFREHGHRLDFEHPEHGTTTLAGIDVASLTLEHRNAQGALLAVLTALWS